MTTHKHLTLSQRHTIESLLNSSSSFKQIGRQIGKNCTTISREIVGHIMFLKSGAYGRSFNDCLFRTSCSSSGVCEVCSNTRSSFCKFCGRCTSSCLLFQKELCPSLSNPPYVCNGCSKLRSCTLEKRRYSASYAHKEYVLHRSESRSGLAINPQEAARLDALISPLIRKGQSIHHICVTSTDTIMCCEKTIYHYVAAGLFSARNIDLPRQVRYRPRKAKPRFKVDRACRKGRTYSDFLSWMSEHPDTPVVQMDSVEGVKGGSVLLTLHFTNSLLMLAFLRKHNDAASVQSIFEQMDQTLGRDLFQNLFPVILTDNGSEFSNPAAIEFDPIGNRRTRIFYCDPSAPYQKGAAENNHELIRRVIPKGVSFSTKSQSDIQLMMNHINSYARKKLNDRSPCSTFSFLHGSNVLEMLDINAIPANEITLDPSLFQK